MNRINKNLVISLVCMMAISGSAIENITQSHSNFKITFIDVGQGDSALIECDKHFILIYWGPKSKADEVCSILDDKFIMD